MLPKYGSLIVSREKPHLVFEKRFDGKRLNIKMLLPEFVDCNCGKVYILKIEYIHFTSLMYIVNRPKTT